MNLYQSKTKKVYDYDDNGNIVEVKQAKKLFAAKSKYDLETPNKYEAVYGTVALTDLTNVKNYQAKELASAHSEVALISDDCLSFNVWKV